MLTCDDGVALHGDQAERWPTWGELRRNPPSGGLNYLLYEVYKQWVAFDPSVQISADHDVLKRSDVPDEIGQLLSTRLNQVVRPKYMLATNTVSGTPQTPESAKAEAELQQHQFFELCQKWFEQQGSGRRGSKRRADEEPSRSADSGLSGRVTPGSATHRGLLKPPASGDAAGATSGSAECAAGSAGDEAGSCGTTPSPDVPLGRQISAALPGLLNSISEIGTVMKDLQGAVGKGDDKLDRLLNFMMGSQGVPAPAPAPEPAPAAEPAPGV